MIEKDTSLPLPPYPSVSRSLNVAAQAVGHEIRSMSQILHCTPRELKKKEAFCSSCTLSLKST